MWYTENSNAAQSKNADCLQQKTGSCQIMKFKTKLAITFLTIILLPVLLSLCAFLGIAVGRPDDLRRRYAGVQYDVGIDRCVQSGDG